MSRLGRAGGDRQEDDRIRFGGGLEISGFHFGTDLDRRQGRAVLELGSDPGDPAVQDHRARAALPAGKQLCQRFEDFIPAVAFPFPDKDQQCFFSQISEKIQEKVSSALSLSL